MSNLTVGLLKQYLRQRSQTELVEEIAELFTRLDTVKDYYQLRLGTDEEALKKYKNIIEKKFFPTRGYGDARLSVARKAVTDFQKVSKTSESLIDLMLFYVETGVRYTNSYGDINEAFYSSLESMYERALKLIRTKKLQAQFNERCKSVVADTRDIGWGFHDMLVQIYSENFENTDFA